jgi:hypothetical protein
METTFIKMIMETPCDIDWRSMSPATDGRHCASCSKTVIDFTILSDEMIAAFLTIDSKKWCGRFTEEQLERIYVRTRIG